MIAEGFSVFSLGNTSFYLQKAYVKDWIDNTMVFLEVDDLDLAFADLKERNLPEKYEGVRLVPIQNHPWGREFFVHDPSGILWHVGQFFHK